jgi:hypothetical protein
MPDDCSHRSEVDGVISIWVEKWRFCVRGSTIVANKGTPLGVTNKSHGKVLDSGHACQLTKDGRWEDNLVQRWVVVRVNCLRCHEPLRAVGRRVHLRVLAANFERETFHPHFDKAVGRTRFERCIVNPHIGVSTRH